MTLRQDIIESTVALLKANVPLVEGRVYAELDRALDDTDFPCLVVNVTNLGVTYQDGEASLQPRLMDLNFAKLVDVVCSEDPRTFKGQSKAVEASTRAAMTLFRSIVTPHFVDCMLVGSQPVHFPSEKGLLGGFTLSFMDVFKVMESDQETPL